MNLKPLYLVISTLSLAAGIYAGWFDARKAQSRLGPSAGDGSIGVVRQVPAIPEPGAVDGQQGSSPSSGADARRTKSPIEPAVPLPGEGPGAERILPASSAEQQQIAAIEDLIAAGDFGEAAKEAEALAQSSRSRARETAERLAAKARVLAHFVPPARPDSQGTTAYRVVLPSGTEKLVSEVEDQGDRYRFKLESGVEWFPLKEDVLSIETADASDLHAAQWKRIQSRIRERSQPVDIYLLGVKKCFQWGLREKGIELLESLLARSDSDLIPRFFGGSGPDEEIVRQWRLAGELYRREEASVPPAEAFDPSARVTTTSLPPPEQTPPDEPEIVEVAPEPPPLPPAASGEASRVIVKVSELYGQAVALYQSTIGRDDQGKLLEKAYERARSAQDLLAALPPSDDVSEWSRKVVTLLNDILKSASF